MVFSSIPFLFFFLPVTLAVYYLLRKISARNLWLIVVSIIFYAWGEKYLWLIASSLVFNYVLGLCLYHFKETNRAALAKTTLIFAVTVNLLILIYFKYFNFILENLNFILVKFNFASIPPKNITLPLGISFFTFQIMSYVIDLYRGRVKVQKSFIKLALYKTLFPQMIAGPIVRYEQIENELSERTVAESDLAYGAFRFIAGFSKKMLIANPMGVLADHFFSLDLQRLGPCCAWLGMIAYTLQIFFDFSGYSDMAIGIGRLFGFHFLENFNYPYASKSITEFWRKWHISLSTWFRDYLYIPLGGNRGSSFRTYLNLMIVFLLCGLWHGASWNFIGWGVFHGLFLVLERMGFSSFLDRLPSSVRHLYTMITVMVGWVLFRSTNLESTGIFLSHLYSFNVNLQDDFFRARFFLPLQTFLVLIAGIALSTPFFNSFFKIDLIPTSENKSAFKLHPVAAGTSLFFFILSIIRLAEGSFNPFIYFRF